MSNITHVFQLSAAKAAEQHRKKEEASLRCQQKQGAQWDLRNEKAKPIRSAVELLSHKGIDISYEGGTVKISRPGFCGGAYNISFSGGGYEISYWSDSAPRKMKKYDGKRKTLKKTLQSIAMMTGEIYPDKAAEIDRVINEVIAAQPHQTLPQRLRAFAPGK